MTLQDTTHPKGREKVQVLDWHLSDGFVRTADGVVVVDTRKHTPPEHTGKESDE